VRLKEPKAFVPRRLTAAIAGSGPPSCCTITAHAAESSTSAATTRAMKGRPRFGGSVSGGAVADGEASVAGSALSPAA